MLTAKHIHTTSSTSEIHYLLPGDFTGRNAYTLSLNAMVAAEKQMAWMMEGRGERLLNHADLFCQRFQTSQRTLRLVQVVYLFPDRLSYALVGRHYGEFSYLPDIHCSFSIYGASVTCE